MNPPVIATAALAALIGGHELMYGIQNPLCDGRPESAGCRIETHSQPEPHAPAPVVSPTATPTGNVSGNVVIEVPVGAISVSGQAPEVRT